ncbi:hypothetical protein BGX33_001596, partial [Mortierella sp. NVP41]
RYTTKDRDSDLDKDRDWLLAVFKKYGHHIRELRIKHAQVLEAVSQGGTCTGLLSLVLEMQHIVEGPRLDIASPVPDISHDDLFAELEVVRSSTKPLEVLFPEHLARTDLDQLDPYQSFKCKEKEAKIAHDWIHTQHLWHLTLINPGLVRLTTSKQVGFVSVSAEFFCATLTSLKNLKELDIYRSPYMLGIWTLWDYLPAGLKSLKMCAEIFALPDPLPEVDPNLRSLSARGKTTINGLLTLLGIFPNLESVGSIDIKDTTEESPVHSNLSPSLPPVPLEGPSLWRLCEIETFRGDTRP